MQTARRFLREWQESGSPARWRIIECGAHDGTLAADILGAKAVVGLHTEDWEHFSETRAQLEAAFASSGILVDTPRGERVVL